MIPEREPEKWLPHPRKAAAAKIPPLQFADGVTRNNNLGPYGFQNWNENNVNSFNENQLEGKSGASSRGNSSSNSVY